MKRRPPTGLSAEGKKLWSSIANEISLDAGGELLLKVLVEANDRRLQARAEIVKTGAVYTDRFGQLKPSPWLAVERDSTLAVQRAFRSLGLDLEEPS